MNQWQKSYSDLLLRLQPLTDFAGVLTGSLSVEGCPTAQFVPTTRALEEAFRVRMGCRLHHTPLI